MRAGLHVLDQAAQSAAAAAAGRFAAADTDAVAVAAHDTDCVSHDIAQRLSSYQRGC